MKISNAHLPLTLVIWIFVNVLTHCPSCDAYRRQYVAEPVAATENQTTKGRKNKQQLSNIVAKAQIMAEKNPEIFFDPPNGSSIEPVMQLDEPSLLLLTKQLSNQTNKARAHVN